MNGPLAQVPVFAVHSLTHAITALEVGAEARSPIVLLSAPDAGIYAGPGWWKALVEAARETAPEATFTAILDCGDDAGAAQGAIRAGIETIVFAGRADVAERLAAIAEQKETRLLRQRPGAALDLARFFFSDTETLRQKCRDHLASPPAIC